MVPVPLPESGPSTAWPPVSCEALFMDMALHDAWYTGDVDALATLYASNQLTRPSGLWGQAKRFFMGTPAPGQSAQRPVKLHVPVAATIARMSSQTMYGEMPKVVLPAADGSDGAADAGAEKSGARKRANARLTDLLDDSAHAAFLEGAELGSALGGTFYRVTWDTSVVPDKPFITAVAADAAIPTFRFGRLVAVTFWTDLPPREDGTPGVYRLLERHEKGRVEWGLYVAADQKRLGTLVPLTEHEATKGLADIVDEESGVDTGTELLTAVYLPNVRPARVRRKDPVASAMGRSDFEGVEGLFDALDEVYTSWMRDIRVARSRLFVHRDVMKENGPGKGASFDADQEVYVPLTGTPTAIGSGAGSGPQKLVEAQQFVIRHEEHKATALDLLVQIFVSCGYSPATFGLDTGTNASSVTATEVMAREKMTTLTRAAKIMYARPQLQHLIAALLDVDEYVFHGPGRGGAMPEVSFPDAAAPTLEDLAEVVQLLRNAEAASTETLVALVNPDWEQEQIDAEVDKIRAERQILPDPTGMTGADLGGADPDDERARGYEVPSTAVDSGRDADGDGIAGEGNDPRRDRRDRRE